MARKVGFSSPDSDTGKIRRKIILLLLVVVVMEAIDIALFIRSIQDSNWMGLAVSVVFGIIVNALMYITIMRLINTFGPPKGDDRTWELDEDFDEGAE